MQGLCHLSLTLSLDLWASCDTPDDVHPCISEVVEVTHEVSQGPLKCARSAQKALYVSKTEPRECRKRTNSKSLSHYFQTVNMKKLVSSPAWFVNRFFFFSHFSSLPWVFFLRMLGRARAFNDFSNSSLTSMFSWPALWFWNSSSCSNVWSHNWQASASRRLGSRVVWLLWLIRSGH